MRGAVAIAAVAGLSACAGGAPEAPVNRAKAQAVARPVVAARVPAGLSDAATTCVIAAGSAEDLAVVAADRGLDPSGDTIDAVVRMAGETGAQDCLGALGIAGLRRDIGA